MLNPSNILPQVQIQRGLTAAIPLKVVQKPDKVLSRMLTVHSPINTNANWEIRIMINTMRSSLLISAVFVCSLFLSASPIRASESAEPAANVRALLNSGIEAYKSANYQAAESSFSKALEISELSSLKGLTSQSYFWLIRVYSAQNKFSAAEAVSRKQIEQLENSSQPAHRMIDALCNLGFLQIKQKKLEEAKLSFERAKKIGDSKDMESIYVFEPFVGLAILQSSQGNLGAMPFS